MGLNAPGSVVAGTGFQANYSYGRDKSGGAVAIIPGGPRSIYAVEAPCGQPGVGGKNKWGQCSPQGPTWYLAQLGAITSAPISGQSGTVSLVAPGSPGQYGLVTIYAPDGGTIDTISLMVVAAAAAPPAASGVPPPPPAIHPTPLQNPSVHEGDFVGNLNAAPSSPVGEIDVVQNGQLVHVASWPQFIAMGGRADVSNVVYVTDATWAAFKQYGVNAPAPAPPPPAPAPPAPPPPLPLYRPPSPEPAASDGQRLSMQGDDVQAYYVSGYGPGILAATQFVVDHEHQLVAIGASHPPPDPCTTAPLISLEQWVNKYGGGVQPGSIYAQVQVPDCPEGPTRVGINTPTRLAVPVTLPAGPGAGGPETGLIGGGGPFSGGGTPTVPNQRQTGAPPPSVGGVVAELTANKPLLIGAAAVAAYMLFGGGGHRR